uniref:Uncharacterized protein n=1 Tax=Tanacetum cinerariifolium TaxID=118510 RepID=A0A699GF48_TANCI|nr:hypothetical protein [Tanacetum cinerariifolium]
MFPDRDQTVGVHQAAARCHHRRFGAGADVELGHDALDVELDRAHADASRARDDLVAHAGGQVAEDVAFARGQLVAMDAAGQLDRHFRHHVFFTGQHGVDARHQVVERRALGHVRAGAGAHAAVRFVFRFVAAEDDDLGARMARADAADRLDAVAVGHVQIHQQQVRLQALAHFHRLLAVGGLAQQRERVLLLDQRRHAGADQRVDVGDNDGCGIERIHGRTPRVIGWCYFAHPRLRRIVIQRYFSMTGALQRLEFEFVEALQKQGVRAVRTHRHDLPGGRRRQVAPFHPGRRQQVAQLGGHAHQVGVLDLGDIVLETEAAAQRLLDGMDALLDIVAPQHHLDRRRPVAEKFLAVVHQRRVRKLRRHQARRHDRVFRHRVPGPRGAAPARLRRQAQRDVGDGHAGGVGLEQVEDKAGGQQDGRAAVRFIVGLMGDAQLRGRRAHALQGHLAVRADDFYPGEPRQLDRPRGPGQGLDHGDRHRHLDHGGRHGRRGRAGPHLLLPGAHLCRRRHGADQRPRAVRLPEIPVRLRDPAGGHGAAALRRRSQGFSPVFAADANCHAPAAGSERHAKNRRRKTRAQRARSDRGSAQAVLVDPRLLQPRRGGLGRHRLAAEKSAHRPDLPQAVPGQRGHQGRVPGHPGGAGHHRQDPQRQAAGLRLRGRAACVRQLPAGPDAGPATGPAGRHPAVLPELRLHGAAGRGADRQFRHRAAEDRHPRRRRGLDDHRLLPERPAWLAEQVRHHRVPAGLAPGRQRRQRAQSAVRPAHRGARPAHLVRLLHQRFQDDQAGVCQPRSSRRRAAGHVARRVQAARLRGAVGTSGRPVAQLVDRVSIAAGRTGRGRPGNHAVAAGRGHARPSAPHGHPARLAVPPGRRRGQHRGRAGRRPAAGGQRAVGHGGQPVRGRQPPQRRPAPRAGRRDGGRAPAPARPLPEDDRARGGRQRHRGRCAAPVHLPRPGHHRHEGRIRRRRDQARFRRDQRDRLPRLAAQAWRRRGTVRQLGARARLLRPGVRLRGRRLRPAQYRGGHAAAGHGAHRLVLQGRHHVQDAGGDGRRGVYAAVPGAAGARRQVRILPQGRGTGAGRAADRQHPHDAAGQGQWRLPAAGGRQRAGLLAEPPQLRPARPRPGGAAAGQGDQPRIALDRLAAGVPGALRRAAAGQGLATRRRFRPGGVRHFHRLAARPVPATAGAQPGAAGHVRQGADGGHAGLPGVAGQGLGADGLVAPAGRAAARAERLHGTVRHVGAHGPAAGARGLAGRSGAAQRVVLLQRAAGGGVSARVRHRVPSAHGAAGQGRRHPPAGTRDCVAMVGRRSGRRVPVAMAGGRQRRHRRAAFRRPVLARQRRPVRALRDVGGGQHEVPAARRPVGIFKPVFDGGLDQDGHQRRLRGSGSHGGHADVARHERPPAGDRRRDRLRPARWYRRSASPPVTVSRTSTDLPAARAASSMAAISLPATPLRRASRCTSILATSARCGWLSGWAVISCTVPTMRPASVCATSSTRSSRAAAASAPRQKASAVERGRGSMKLTDAPPSTQSTRTSDNASASNAAWSRASAAVTRRTVMADDAVRSAAGAPVCTAAGAVVGAGFCARSGDAVCAGEVILSSVQPDQRPLPLLSSPRAPLELKRCVVCAAAAAASCLLS